MVCKNHVILLMLASQVLFLSGVDCIPDDTHTSPGYQFSIKGFIDLEKLLEENPEIEAAFVCLTQEEQQEFLAIIQLFNELFQEALSEELQSQSFS